MDFINTSKEKIEGLNNRFFFVMENFIDKYVNYLKNPQNANYTSDVNHVFDTITNINADSLLLKNSIQKTIDENDEKILKMNQEIDRLKPHNERLRSKVKKLHIQAITSEGMFDSELDWYKKQMLLIIIMLFGIVYGVKLVYELQMTTKQIVIPGTILVLLSLVYHRVTK